MKIYIKKIKDGTLYIYKMMQIEIWIIFIPLIMKKLKINIKLIKEKLADLPKRQKYYRI